MPSPWRFYRYRHNLLRRLWRDYPIDGFIAGIFHDLHPPFSDRRYLWGIDDVLHEGGVHIWAWGSDSDEATGIDTTWPTIDQNLRFIFWIVVGCHRIPSVYGFFRQRQGLPDLLRKRLYGSSYLHGYVEDLLRKEGGGPCLGLAETDCWRHCVGALMDFLPCLHLEREIWLASAPNWFFPLSVQCSA